MTSQPKVDVGYQLPSLTKTITLEKMRAYSGWPRRSIHTDDEVARQGGLPRAVLQGIQNMTYLSEMLLKFFGQNWIKTGKISITFIGLVFPGDTMTTKAVVKEKVAEGKATRLVLDIWVENQKGERVVVGTASALMP